MIKLLILLLLMIFVISYCPCAFGYALFKPDSIFGVELASNAESLMPLVSFSNWMDPWLLNTKLLLFFGLLSGDLSFLELLDGPSGLIGTTDPLECSLFGFGATRCCFLELDMTEGGITSLSMPSSSSMSTSMPMSSS